MAEEKAAPGRKKRKQCQQRLTPSKKFETSNESYTDFMCPICLQLLIQPVVLPCKHELCMPCFQAHVEATSLCCPMCRVRISNWARKKGREGTLIDQERWNVIQKLFPERCKRRLKGEDEEDDNDVPMNCETFRPVVAEQGELRKEYEKELLKVELEKQEEMKASEEVIKKMVEEEKQKQEILKEDEMIAKKMQDEELDNAGDRLTSPNSKLNHFLEACKMPQEMVLRSSNTNVPSQSKSNSCLTNWLAKSCPGSPSESAEEFVSPHHLKRTPIRTRQEQEDYELAFRLQRELDYESKGSTPKRHTLTKHFYPLRQRTSSSTESQPAKKLETS
eukprot:gene16183-7549_t